VGSVNSTATGGGVAELLRSLIPYCRDAGIDARWLVIEGTPAFFTVTKRIHNMLHGHPGDGGPLGADERALYEQVLAANATSLRGSVSERDVVVLHDPQTAGLLPLLADSGAALIWRCHVGIDHTDPVARAAWEFLTPYVQLADRIVASPRSALPHLLAAIPTHRIAPSIDPCATKNLGMADATARAILARAGLTAAPRGDCEATFTRCDGTRRGIERQARVLREGAGLRLGRGPLIAHLGRWDRLKDPIGVLEAFAGHVPVRLGAHLILAGPDVDAVTDDPEGQYGPRRARAGMGRVAACLAAPRDDRHAPHGRSPRERGDRQRPPAPSGRRGQEKPAGGLRARCHGGAVEASTSGRHARRRHR
jgi:trehalose synthase